MVRVTVKSKGPPTRWVGGGGGGGPDPKKAPPPPPPKKVGSNGIPAGPSGTPAGTPAGLWRDSDGTPVVIIVTSVTIILISNQYAISK